MGLCLSGLPVSLRVVADGQLYALDGGQIADGSRGDEFALVHISSEPCEFVVVERTVLGYASVGGLVLLAVAVVFLAFAVRGR